MHALHAIAKEMEKHSELPDRILSSVALSPSEEPSRPNGDDTD